MECLIGQMKTEPDFCSRVGFCVYFSDITSVNVSIIHPVNSSVIIVYPYRPCRNRFLKRGGDIFAGYAYGLNGGYGVRPVVFLSADITLSGEGTETQPYTIN